MKKRIIAVAFILIMVLATLSNTVFAKQSEESFKENIQNTIKSIALKIDNNFIENIIIIILKIIFALNIPFVFIGIIICNIYFILYFIITEFSPALGQIFAAMFAIIFFIPYAIVAGILILLYDIWHQDIDWDIF